MANIFKEKRFILDTAGTTLLKGTLAPGESRDLRIKGIRWVGATTAGHACVIQDEDSVVYWESLASGANYIESDLMERVWQKDFKLVTLASGRVYIYLYAGQF